MDSDKGAMRYGKVQNIGFESPEEKEIILMLLKKYNKYLTTSKMETHERYKFFSRMKKENESIEDYIAVLRERAKTCNFDSLADSFIRDKIILDTKDEMLRRILLDTEDIDLKKIIIIYQFHEATCGKKNRNCTNKEFETKIRNIFPSKPNAQIEYSKVCSKCGTHHAFRNCPAFHSKCRKCEGLGHYAKMCNPYLSRISFKPNRPDSKSNGPFTQIDKNSKGGNNPGKKISTSNKKDKYLSGGQFPQRIPPPKYTKFPTTTETFSSGYIRPSTSQEKPHQAAIQNVSTAHSGEKSTSSVSDNATVAKDMQTKRSLNANRRTTSSSNIKSTSKCINREADDDFAVKCCSCLLC